MEKTVFLIASSGGTPYQGMDRKDKEWRWSLPSWNAPRVHLALDIADASAFRGEREISDAKCTSDRKMVEHRKTCLIK